MGLTSASTGRNLLDKTELHAKDTHLLVLAGSPNVGKSTVFNALTGLNQHTGNWTGKTVSTAVGRVDFEDKTYLLADVPGTYSLCARSAEEEVARDFICFGGAEGVIVVCDALCLGRNLSLVLQIAAFTPNVIVCVNLLDQAEKKGVRYDLEMLSAELGLAVIPCAAKHGRGLEELMRAAAHLCETPAADAADAAAAVCRAVFPEPVETAVQKLTAVIADTNPALPARFAAEKLLCCDTEMIKALETHFEAALLENPAVAAVWEQARAALLAAGYDCEKICDAVAESLQNTGKALAEKATLAAGNAYGGTDRRIDALLCGRWTAFPLMFLFLMGIFWLTMEGANLPSAFLSRILFSAETPLFEVLCALHLPRMLCELLIFGVYRVVAWVVSVMLPPMAIFFPLFTLLEDIGFLPRIAFNLDRLFAACHACGKQALTMCMGFGCNAAGVVGCRIIDSPRERLVAILTNSFVPCNGRFPLFVTLISLFLAVGSGSVKAAFLLAAFIVLGIGCTLLASFLLGRTVLKGKPSAFTLELPPYRMPNVRQVAVRSFLDRTLFVLGRAVLAAAPAGVLIWVLANVTVGGSTLLAHCTGFLDPFARFFGLDGVILMAFLLALPANEIVLPVMVMAYMANGSLASMDNRALQGVLTANGWTAVTAVCVILFSLLHFPCATTLMTVKKETGSLKWTVFAAVLPTVFGLAACFLVTHLFGG